MLATLRRPKVPVVSIIDDDKSVRAATNRLVRSLGLEPHMFSSAEEFLQSPQRNGSSCVIADIRMPGISGVALQKLLMDEGQNLPIIFITAFPEEKIKDQALEAGAVAYLAKPFDGKTMIKCLGEAIKRASDKPSE